MTASFMDSKSVLLKGPQPFVAPEDQLFLAGRQSVHRPRVGGWFWFHAHNIYCVLYYYYISLSSQIISHYYPRGRRPLLYRAIIANTESTLAGLSRKKRD